MKYLKILLTFVLAIVVFNTNNAASVVAVSNTALTSSYVVPKNEAKKKKQLKEKHKKENRSFLYKVMGGGSGMGIAGFFLGLLGFTFWFVPYWGPILCVLGIIFGAIGINKPKKGFAIAGLAMGLVGIIVIIVIYMLI